MSLQMTFNRIFKVMPLVIINDKCANLSALTLLLWRRVLELGVLPITDRGHTICRMRGCCSLFKYPIYVFDFFSFLCNSPRPAIQSMRALCCYLIKVLAGCSDQISNNKIFLRSLCYKMYISEVDGGSNERRLLNDLLQVNMTTKFRNSFHNIWRHFCPQRSLNTRVPTTATLFKCQLRTVSLEILWCEISTK